MSQGEREKRATGGRRKKEEKKERKRKMEKEKGIREKKNEWAMCHPLSGGFFNFSKIQNLTHNILKIL